MTGDELEALELDATANGAPLYWSDDVHGETYVNNTVYHNDPATASQFLPFLTAFASTGYVFH